MIESHTQEAALVSRSMLEIKPHALVDTELALSVVTDPNAFPGPVAEAALFNM